MTKNYSGWFCDESAGIPVRFADGLA